MTNTFPPLISSGSQDSFGRRQFLGVEVLDSLLIEASPTDPFFQPSKGLTGFAANGFHYNNGVKDLNTRASWILEPPSAYRGEGGFPTKTLCLLSDVGLSLLDATTNKMAMWMTFVRQDSFLFLNNPHGGLAGYLPTKLTYGVGCLFVTFQPDPGNQNQTPLLLTIDFGQDTAYVVDLDAPQTLTTTHPTTGVLQGELDWLQRHTHPTLGLWGWVEAQWVGGVPVRGRYEMWGPTLTPKPRPIINTTTYPDNYVGEVSGVVFHHDPTYSFYAVKGGVLTNGMVVYQDTTTLNLDGTYNFLYLYEGPKVVELWDTFTNTKITSSQEAYDIIQEAQGVVWDGGVEVLCFPLRLDHTWELPQNSIPSGTDLEVGVIDVTSGVVVSREGRGRGLMATSGATQLCNLRSQSTLLLVGPLLGDNATLEYHVQGILQAQNSDGSWGEDYSLLTGAYTRPDHKTTLTQARILYSLLWVYPALTVITRAQIQTSFAQALTYLGGLSDGFGLYLEGFGTFDEAGAYVAAPVAHAYLETNTWLYSMLRLGEALFPANPMIATAISTMAPALEGLWTGSYFSAQRGDMSESLVGDVMSLYLTAMLQHPERAWGIYQRIRQNYHQTNTKTEGVGSHPGRVETQMSRMLAMACLRSPSTQPYWDVEIKKGVEARSTASGGWSGPEITDYLDGVENVNDTAWSVLASHAATRNSILL